MGRTRVQIPVALVIIFSLIAPQLAAANTQSQQHYAKGLIPFQAGQWQSAYASFTNATKADPDDAVALYYRGITGAHLGFQQEAITDVERALALRPDLDSAVLDLGVLYLEAGEYQSAQSWLERAYEIPETRFRAALFLGIAEFRRGDDAAAQSSLQNAAKDPRLRPIANYYEALSLMRQGKTAAAEPLLASTEQAMPGTQIATAIEEFDTTALPQLRAGIPGDKAWTVYGGLGIAYDSNVKLAPNNNTIKQSRNYGSEDVGRLVIQFGGAYRVLDTERFVGTLAYDGYQGVNFGETDYDISSHRFTGNFSTRADRWYQVGVSSFYNYYGRDYQSFFHEGSLVPWVAFYEGELTATQLYYRLRGRDYTRNPFDSRENLGVVRDAINNALGVRQLFLLGAVDRVFSVGYQWSDNDPLSSEGGTDFAYMAHQFEFQLDAAVMDWFDASLGYTVAIGDYEHPNSRTGYVYGRNDVEHQFVIHLERPVMDHLTVVVDYFGVLNHSNLDEFEYDRNIVSAGVSTRF